MSGIFCAGTNNIRIPLWAHRELAVHAIITTEQRMNINRVPLSSPRTPFNPTCTACMSEKEQKISVYIRVNLTKREFLSRQLRGTDPQIFSTIPQSKLFDFDESTCWKFSSLPLELEGKSNNEHDKETMKKGKIRLFFKIIASVKVMKSKLNGSEVTLLRDVLSRILANSTLCRPVMKQKKFLFSWSRLWRKRWRHLIMWMLSHSLLTSYFCQIREKIASF